MREFSTISLFRCTEQRYAEAFCTKGTMKFNKPKYWIELEAKEGKGRGDYLEGIYASVNMLDLDSLLFARKIRSSIRVDTLKGITYFRDEKTLELPCFCLYGLNDAHFSNILKDEKGKKHYTFIVKKSYFDDFSNGSTRGLCENLPEERKPVLLMITNVHEFFERVKNAFEKIGVKREDIIISPVEYINKKKNFISSVKPPYELFLKDIDFKYQNEIRIIINTVDKTILKRLEKLNYIIDIGNLEDIAKIEKFYYKDMFIEKDGNSILYELSEPIITELKDLTEDKLVEILYSIVTGKIQLKNQEKRKILMELEKLLAEKYGRYDIKIEQNGKIIYGDT